MTSLEKGDGPAMGLVIVLVVEVCRALQMTGINYFTWYSCRREDFSRRTANQQGGDRAYSSIEQCVRTHEGYEAAGVHTTATGEIIRRRVLRRILQV